MARNPKPKQDNPEQPKRFIETAQALDADDSAAAFERVREGHFRHFSTGENSGGQPQIYEINTNPHVGRVTKHPFPIRIEAEKLIHDRLIEVFQSIDRAPGGSNIRIDGHPLVRRRKSRYLPWKNLCP